MATKHYGAALRDAVLRLNEPVGAIAADMGISRAFLYRMFDMPVMDDITVGIACRVVSYFPQLRCFFCAAKHAASTRPTHSASRARR